MEGFKKGTKVLVDLNNTYKNIEELKQGDLVATYDETTKSLKLNPIGFIFMLQCNELTKYTFDNSIELYGCKDIKFLTINGYKENIDIGDEIITTTESAKLVNKESISNDIIYELDIENIDNYIVEGIVAHNAAAYYAKLQLASNDYNNYGTPVYVWYYGSSGSSFSSYMRLLPTSTATIAIPQSYQTSAKVSYRLSTSSASSTTTWANHTFTLNSSTTLETPSCSNVFGTSYTTDSAGTTSSSCPTYYVYIKGKSPYIYNTNQPSSLTTCREYVLANNSSKWSGSTGLYWYQPKPITLKEGTKSISTVTSNYAYWFAFIPDATVSYSINFERTTAVSSYDTGHSIWYKNGSTWTKLTSDDDSSIYGGNQPGSTITLTAGVPYYVQLSYYSLRNTWNPTSGNKLGVTNTFNIHIMKMPVFSSFSSGYAMITNSNPYSVICRYGTSNSWSSLTNSVTISSGSYGSISGLSTGTTYYFAFESTSAPLGKTQIVSKTMS